MVGFGSVNLLTTALLLTSLVYTDIIQGEIPDFQIDGVQKIMYNHERKTQSPFQGLEALDGSSRVLDALLCYLSLILKHSDTNRDTKNN